MAILLTQQVIQLALILLCGFALVKMGLLKGEDSRALSVLCIYLVCPACVLNAFQIEYAPEIAANFLLAVLSGVMIHVLLFAAVYGLNLIFHFSGIEKASLLYSNAGNLIIPLVSAVLGEEWVIYTSAFIMVQLVVIWTHGKSVIEGRRTMDVRAILTNVNLLACGAGLVMFLFRLHFPPIIHGTVKTLGSLLGPVSMLMLGMILAGTDIRGMLRGKRIWIISVLKMIILPVFVLLVMKHCGITGRTADGETIIFISLLAYMTPTAATVTQMAQLYDCEPGYATAINTVTTIFCLFTIPLLTLLYEL